MTGDRKLRADAYRRNAETYDDWRKDFIARAALYRADIETFTAARDPERVELAIRSAAAHDVMAATSLELATIMRERAALEGAGDE